MVALRFFTGASLLFMVSCSAPQQSLKPTYADPSTVSQVATGLGFESQDIRAMTDLMVRDILANDVFLNPNHVARIVIDDGKFVNESNQVFNIGMLVDRLRIELMRASRGRLEFVTRKDMDVVKQEQEMQGDKNVDKGGTSTANMLHGADYRMIGKITSLATASDKSGVRSNYYQFSFEVLDLHTGQLIWGNLYDMKKAGADDTIYR